MGLVLPIYHFGTLGFLLSVSWYSRTAFRVASDFRMLLSAIDGRSSMQNQCPTSITISQQ